ncbi:hypothetical protein ASF89_00685 [Frigoribacterium sp. Leaf172]|nr:hypothetical protein ASF89_00685 [Frigoribacterium sp. Leaf172]
MHGEISDAKKERDAGVFESLGKFFQRRPRQSWITKSFDASVICAVVHGGHYLSDDPVQKFEGVDGILLCPLPMSTWPISLVALKAFKEQGPDGSKEPLDMSFVASLQLASILDADAS